MGEGDTGTSFGRDSEFNKRREERRPGRSVNKINQSETGDSPAWRWSIDSSNQDFARVDHGLVHFAYGNQHQLNERLWGLYLIVSRKGSLIILENRHPVLETDAHVGESRDGWHFKHKWKYHDAKSGYGRYVPLVGPCGPRLFGASEM